jgi:pyridoxine kinase
LTWTRLISEVKITDTETLKQAIQVMHERYRIPHIMITSVNLDGLAQPPAHLSVIGSTMTSGCKPRLFKVTFPAMDCYFSGTGDMFAALTVVRMREAVYHVAALKGVPSWVSDDSVGPLDLPLARAAEKVVASMHEVLSKTQHGLKAEVAKVEARVDAGTDEGRKELHLARSKAAELKLVRNLSCLRTPSIQFKAVDI